MSILVQFAIGLVFGLGLVIAGMSDPAKVQKLVVSDAHEGAGCGPVRRA